MISSLWSNFRFELTSRKKLIGPYVYAFISFALVTLIILFAGGAFKGITANFGLGQKVLINGPWAISRLLGLFFLIGIFMVSPIFGSAICKDYDAKFDSILSATPANRTGFYLGRFFGAAAACSLIFFCMILGYGLTSASPFVQKSLFGPNPIVNYLYAFSLVILPNIFIFGSLFFAVGAYVKKMAGVYIAGILCFMLYNISGTLSGNIDSKTVQAMIDPFGIKALNILTQYWSVADKNQSLVPMSGVLLWNRLLWGSVGALLLTSAIFLAQRPKKVRTRKLDESLAPDLLKPSISDRDKNLISDLNKSLNFSTSSRLKLFFSQAVFEAKSAFSNVYFLCIVLAGLGMIATTSAEIGKQYGTQSYPVTYLVLEATSGAFGLFFIIISTFYTAELIWRERQSRIDQILDAMPVPLWITTFAKFIGLQLILLSLQVLIAAAGIIIQLVKGYTHFELGQVFTTLFAFSYLSSLVLSTLIFAIHAVVNNKYIAHGIVVLFYLFLGFAPQLGLENVLYQFGSGMEFTRYSDMNGYSASVPRVFYFQIYWGLAATLLLFVTYLFWPKGTDSAFSRRWQNAKARITKPMAAAMVLVGIGFVAQGSYIYYNTHILNEFKTTKDQELDSLHYEQTYKAAYDNKPKLKNIKTRAEVDIFPAKLRMKGRVSFTLKNKSAAPVDDLFVILPIQRKFTDLQFDREVKRVQNDDKASVYIYQFTKPVLPGETILANYKVDYGYEGIRNGNNPVDIAENGTFFNNTSFFPTFGYSSEIELSSDKVREQYGLLPKPRMPPITDMSARQRNVIGNGMSDWIEFESIVSTDADQIAVAPGYLQKEWREGERRFFAYKMDRPILDFYAFLSARYEVKREVYKGINLEIYYHKGHEYNLDAMMNGSKAGLDYFSANFGPYQHRQFRILEFPRYRDFAQSFPNTVPFSESMGFITQVNPNDPEDLDFPFYVTAHELAHQWWAHQVIGADTQGSAMLMEATSQYSALMVMEKKYGRDRMERFLKHEMDYYLRARSSEMKKEMPVALSENQQYIHYNKGSLVFFALKELIGEQDLNAAILKYIEKVRFQEAPYTTAIEFVETLKQNVDPKFHPLIDDLLLKITLFDNRIEKQELKAEADGTYTVQLNVLGRKAYVDDKGEEIDTDFTQDFIIDIKDKDDKVITSQVFPLHRGENLITMKVKLDVKTALKPAKVSLDSMGIWIDKNRSDNKGNL